MKFGQLKEYNKKIFSFEKPSRKWAGRLYPELFLFLKGFI